MGQPPGKQLPAFGANIPALDGVRGIAILLVLLYHYEAGRWVPTNLAEQVLSYGINLGWMGLELFFVLSGFLITGVLYETKSHPRYFHNFYMRRVIRILPLYYGVLVVIFFVRPLLPGGWATPASTQVWYWSHLSNFLFVFHGWGAAYPGTGHFWSLAVEEHFYLAWPLLVFLSTRRGMMALSGACLAGSLLLRVALLARGWSPNAVFLLTFTHLDALAVGSLLALAVRGPGGLPHMLPIARRVAFGAAAALLGVFLWRSSVLFREPVIQTLGFTLSAIVCGSLVLLAVPTRGGIGGAVMNNSVMRTIGLRSYGLYVFHFPILNTLERRGLTLEWFERHLGSGLPGHLGFVGLNAGLTIAVTLVSWHFFEQKFMKLKRRYSYTLPPESQPANAESTVTPGAAPG